MIKKLLSLPWRFLTWFRQILANLLLLIVIIIAVAAYFAKETPINLPQEGALLVSPTGVLVEQLSYVDPMSLLFADDSKPDPETALHDLVASIRHAATDNNITGLVIDAGWMQGADPSKLRSVGDAIDYFRKSSNKPVYAIADHYSQAQYFLASYADEILLNPNGGVYLRGFGAYPSFYKDALDKLKISVHVFRVGGYKSAVEPFISNAMSEQTKQNTALWLTDVWQSFTTAIEHQRELEAGAINDYINGLDERLEINEGDVAQAALQAGLVDRVSTRDEMRDFLIEKFGGSSDGEGFQFVEWKPYARKLRDKQKVSGDKVGVIIANGIILDGEHPAGTIGGDTLAQHIQDARADDDVRALVLRIDSPGGSAFAAEIIRREVQLTQEAGIPVVASFGGAAASGGYWIASTADEIWSTASSITGSIGVFRMVPVFDQSLAALGIHSDGVGTTRLSDAWHLDRPLNPVLQNTLQLEADRVYRQFLELVASGRKSTPARIHTVAQGQVWTGLQAQQNNLVDQLGDLEHAVAAAARLADLGDNFQWEIIEPSLSPKEQFLRELTSKASVLLQGVGKPVRNSLFEKLRAQVERPLQLLESFNDPKGIYSRCMECRIQ